MGVLLCDGRPAHEHSSQRKSLGSETRDLRLGSGLVSRISYLVSRVSGLALYLFGSLTTTQAPPNRADVVSSSEPPDASAVRRTMSSPSPDESPVEAPRSTASGCRDAGPSVLDFEPERSVWRSSEPDRQRNTLVGVSEYVLEQRVDHRDSIHSRDRHSSVLDRRRDRERAILFFAQCQPVGRPFLNHLDEIATRVDLGANRPTPFRDDEVGGSFEFVEIVDDPIPGATRRECLCVQLRRRERSSEPVGEIRGGLSFLLQQVLDLFAPAG